jgi:LPS export ABC transporter protein LptC
MVKTKRKTLIIVALLAVILAGAALSFLYLREPPEKALLKIMSDRVDLQVKNVHFTEVDPAGVKWEIRADTARYQKKDHLAFFEKVMVRMVTRDGRAFEMSGDHGRFDSQSRDVEIEGNVVILSEGGDRFRTDRLTYRDGSRRVETDRPVVMENGNVRISGVGMVFDLDEKKVTLKSQIRAQSIEK